MAEVAFVGLQSISATYLLNHIEWKLRRGREGDLNTWQEFSYQVRLLRLGPTSLFTAEMLQGKCFASTPMPVQLHSPLASINFSRLLNTSFRQRHQLVSDLFSWGSEIYPACLQSFSWSTHTCSSWHFPHLTFSVFSPDPLASLPLSWVQTFVWAANDHHPGTPCWCFVRCWSRDPWYPP